VKRLALVTISLLGATVSSASATDLPKRADFVIKRPGNKALFVHLELRTAKGRTSILGCQIGSREKRCTRKRTRVPLAKAHLAELKALWVTFANRDQCLLRRLPESWGQIWIYEGKVAFQGPMVPSRDHQSLGTKCFVHAKLGWWLLDRYDQRK